MSTSPDPVNLYYDSDVSLSALVKLVGDAKLGAVLTALLGEDTRLISSDGQVLFGAAQATGLSRVAVRIELEPVGYLESAHTEKLGPAADLLELLLVSSARYHMASAIQMESVQADYEALERQNAALVESEARYRVLAGELEQRVNEQVQAIQASHRQLYQTEKLASVGQLAAGVAHEINNPIGFVKSNLSTASAYLERLAAFAAQLSQEPSGSQLAATWQRNDLGPMLDDFSVLVRESLDGIERVARIVGDLKDFASVNRSVQAPVEINGLLQSLCNVAANVLRGRAELEFDFGPPVVVYGHHNKLSQIFLNLLFNAAQSMDTPGRIALSTRVENGYARVQVSDTGCGISEANRERIFDPFFTTREVGQGTGLGLTVARDVVLAHGGQIRVESEIGKGTTVTVDLPVNEPVRDQLD